MNETDMPTYIEWPIIIVSPDPHHRLYIDYIYYIVV